MFFTSLLYLQLQVTFSNFHLIHKALKYYLRYILTNIQYCDTTKFQEFWRRLCEFPSVYCIFCANKTEMCLLISEKGTYEKVFIWENYLEIKI